MIVFPPCKINLGLSVVSKRADGYHNLETLFYHVPLNDALEVALNHDKEAAPVSVHNYGIPVVGNTESNLVYKAYQLLAQDYTLPKLSFCLNKQIPMGAGLGGGSSDGAYALRLINSFLNLNLSTETLIQYASKLGSDCAFFIHNQPCLGTGRGEILQPVSFTLEGWYLVLVKPHIHISTAQAFSGIMPQQPKYAVADIIQEPIESWKGRLHNDFENSVFPQYPQLADIKEKLYTAGASYAAMSGSGSTIFGLFRVEPKLKKQFPEMFYWEGML